MQATGASAGQKASGKGVGEKQAIILPPDMPIIIEARVKAGEKTLQLKAIANLLLHDPVLTLEVMQFSNSVMFGGTSVKDLESALSRIGVAKLVTLLSQINSQVPDLDEEVIDAFEILRYNCRRISIVSLIIAAVAKPALANLARMAGLFGDVGHMVALHQFGKKYCEIAKSNKRKNIPFRLEKDFKFNIQKQMVNFLKLKGLPRLLYIPYDLEEDTKGVQEVDLRLVVQSALEMIDAYDSGKFAVYAAAVSLPAQSFVRLLKLTGPQLDKVQRTVADYLRTAAADEAPEGASLLISSVDEDEAPEALPEGTETIRIPTYPNLSVNAKSREALKSFFNLCEQETDIENLTRLSTGYLRDSGLFDRAALIQVNPEGTQAKIIQSCGLSSHAGETIPVTDPLSPFRALRLEIKSANTKSAQMSAPFGMSAYAIGPIDLQPDGGRLVLYVDRASAQGLGMESRRVFRLVLGLLMRSVQEMRQV